MAKFSPFKFKQTENRRALRLIWLVSNPDNPADDKEGVAYRTTKSGKRRPIKPGVKR